MTVLKPKLILSLESASLEIPLFNNIDRTIKSSLISTITGGVLKKTKSGAKPIWVKVGKTDLNYVEIREGIQKTELVYVLPSEGLIKYQQKFSERVKSNFG